MTRKRADGKTDRDRSVLPPPPLVHALHRPRAAPHLVWIPIRGFLPRSRTTRQAIPPPTAAGCTRVLSPRDARPAKAGTPATTGFARLGGLRLLAGKEQCRNGR